jgi:electron transfer flavoprotein beta subunit
MKIVVAIKQVPERDVPMRIGASGRWIDEDGLQFAMNEPDAYALEHALALRQKHGGEVVVLSAGPERAAATLREALAKGADRAIHVLSGKLDECDALGVARLLAAAIEPEQPDMVLCGLQSEDLGYGQTGVLLAELLDLPHASLVLEIEMTDGGARVKLELEEGWMQMVELPLPAVLAVQSGGVPLSYATLMGIKRARTKELRTVAAADLVTQTGMDLTPVVTLESIALPRKTRSTELLGGTPREAAAALVEKLRNEAHAL